jgi:hypothetical protein
MGFSKKKIKKIFLITGFCLLVTSSFIILISLKYGDTIIKVVINKINKDVNAEIVVKSIDFSIFRRFPYAAVVLNDVEIKSDKNFLISDKAFQNIPLLKANKIYIEFNLFNILVKDYSIHKIIADKGDINLIINKEGFQNFDIFKTANENDKSPNILNLSGIVLKNFHYLFNDLKHEVFLKGDAMRFELKGQISNTTSSFNIYINLFSKSVNINKSDYFINNTVVSNILIRKNFELFDIKAKSFRVENINFNIDFLYNSGKYENIKLIIKTKDEDLNQLQKILPEKYAKYFLTFKSNGKLTLDFIINGKIYANYFPHIDLSFRLEKGEIIQKKSGTKLSNISFHGNYSNGVRNNMETSSFRLTKFTSLLNDGEINGEVSLFNFRKPQIKLDLKSSMDLNEIKKFISSDTIENLKGKLKLDLHLNMGLNNSDYFNGDNISSIQISGNLKILDSELKLRNNNYIYNNINADILLGNDFQINQFSLNIDNNDFYLKGQLNQVVPFFLKQTSTIILQADLRSGNLDLSNYFEKKPLITSKNKYDANVLFPQNLIAELNVSIGKFTIQKFHSKNVIARVNYKPGMYTLKSVVFETMQGRISGNGAVMKDINKTLFVRAQTSLKSIDINQLFTSFGNFGQSILMDKHLRGRLSGEVLFSSDWNNNMVINKDAILVESSLNIKNGELINFEPLQGLSRFISLSELKDIKFSTLQNQIYIRHQQIIIPKMEISSSAFNISGSGIHNFDNHYSYNIYVLLSEVLARKAKQNKKENDEYGIIEDDGLGNTKIPLVIIGYDNNYKINYDTKGMGLSVKESLKSQKKELKSIFNDEFGLFKNDSSIKVKPKNNIKFKVQWDEDNSKQKQNTILPKSNKKNSSEEEENLQLEFEK